MVHRGLPGEVRREWHDPRCFQLGEAGRNGETGRRGRRRSQGCRVALTDHAGPCVAPEPMRRKSGSYVVRGGVRPGSAGALAGRGCGVV